MAFTNNLFHPMLSAAASTAVEASLHTAAPDGDGSDEVSGGEYERLPVSWESPAGGSIAATGELAFSTPAMTGDTEVTHVGLRDAEGNWLGPVPLAQAQPSPTPSVVTVEPLVLDMAAGVATARARVKKK
ncbi:hypothetical protein J4H86_21120 [Spiractinospora alimapuensis]|uniref:phage tail fiber protein n=1 Tax=Spiractinospora alimapuensis TaxID=2820884 RepID=UPI001F165B9D|nr:hypothetical protein [Spiractinospora alimapuensis]QVQ51296.1 hypothetical protein J4H86_21120 [Spiractinospora alimapuensis]